MRKTLIITAILLISFIWLSPDTVLAHQPRIVEDAETVVVDPEISKAYYGTLSGVPHTYTIDSETDFDLYVGILVPDTASSQKDVTATIYKGDDLLVTIGGKSAKWKTFFEPFGQSSYWDGGEYKAQAEAGTYRIVVSSTNNDSKYSLAIGEVEAFDGKEGLNALNLIPDLKRDFFEESPVSFIKSPFGWGYILIMYIFAFIVGFLYRAILKRFAQGSVRGVQRNIGEGDRIVRLVIWLSLLIWAITTSWNPLILFFSGFALFEAIFSWCGLYAAIGKNTCPIN